MATPFRLTRTQWFVLAAAWMGWVFDIMDTYLFAVAKTPMLKEMLGGPEAYARVGAAIEGRIQSWFVVGWAIGGFIFGVLADRWGRTRTLMVTIAVYCGLCGLTALCRTPEQVLVVRFLTALGIGGEWAAGAALVAESLPDSARARAATFIQSASAIGPILGASVNLINAHFTSDWRPLFVVGVFPAVVCLFIRRYVPEPERRIHAAKLDLGEFWRDRSLRRNLLVACVIGVVGVTGAGIVPFWLQNLVNEVSRGLAATDSAQRVSIATYWLHAGTLLGVVATPLLAERIGRRRAIAACFVGAPLSVWLALTVGKTYASLLWALPLTSFFSIGVSAVFVLYFPELFPSRLRATGAGAAYNVGRVVSSPVPAITGSIISQTHSVGTGLLAASSIYVIGLIAAPFATETRGETLPD